MKKLNLKYIKKQRLKQKISSKEMAAALGLKTSANYYKYETGSYRLKADMLPCLAQKLNCSIENFFS